MRERIRVLLGEGALGGMGEVTAAADEADAVEQAGRVGHGKGEAVPP